MVEAVANHDNPERMERTGFDLAAVVYTANCLADKVRKARTGRGIERALVVDSEYLRQLGAADHNSEFRQMAEQAALSLDGRAISGA